MITKHIEGLDWLTDSPSVFIHGDVVVYHCVSELTKRRYWQISSAGENMNTCYDDRQTAMQFAKRYHIGSNFGEFGR